MNRQLFFRAFTLIEVLVVVSLIGILSAVIYANFSNARVEARNRSFQTELKEVQLALELYKAQNDEYPATGSWVSDLVPEFVPSVPVDDDSANDSCDVEYDRDAAGWYKITALNCHGGDTDVAEDSEFARCPSYCGACGTAPNKIDPYDETDTLFTKTYAIYSTGGECE